MIAEAISCKTKPLTSATVLRFEGVRLAHRKRIILDRLSIELGQGERLLVHGPARSGKSALLLAAAGLLRPKEGLITVRDIPAWTKAGKNQTGFVAACRPMYSFLSLKENLLLEASLRGIHPRKVEAMIERFELGEWMDQRPHRVPEWPRLRADLARATLHEPELLLLDEPTLSLDEPEVFWDWADRYEKSLVITTRSQRESRGDRLIRLS